MSENGEFVKNGLYVKSNDFLPWLMAELSIK